MLRPRHQYRMLQAAFVFALIGVAFWASYVGYRASEYPAYAQPNKNAHGIDYPSALWHWLTHDAAGFFAAILCVITTVLAWVTYGLFVATAKLAADAEKSGAAALVASTEATHLAREEFNATHRPEIIVHNFEAFRDAIDEDRFTIGAQFTVVNKGLSDGVIADIGGAIFLRETPPTIGTAMPSRGYANRPLAAGQIIRDVMISGGALESAEVAFREGFGDNRRVLWCVGRIIYEDSEGRRRETGFCRSYDASGHRWVKEPDSDYEYSY